MMEGIGGEDEIVVGVNGPGAIGGLTLRALDPNSPIRIGAINGGNAEKMVKAMKFSSNYGKFDGTLESNGPNSFIVNGIEIPVSNEREDLGAIPWPDAVRYILECTGYHNDSSAAGHLENSNVRRAILSAPGPQGIPMFVMGANHEAYKARENPTVISNASCTTNSLAPVLGLLRNKFTVVGGTFITIHAPTKSQSILDTMHGRSGMNLVPESTGAAKAIGRILPDLHGKIDGTALRIPTPNSASFLSITLTIEEATNVEEVNQIFKDASQDEIMKRYIGVADEGCVGVDFKGSPLSSILVPESTIVTNGGKTIQVQFWYDNEWGYTQRLLDLTEHVAVEDKEYINSQK